MATCNKPKAGGAKQKFTPEEDAVILKLVQYYGTKDWKKIADHLSNRKARQVRERYINYLDPTIDKRKWTIQEEEFLNDMVNKFGKRWKYISSYFIGRTDVSIKNHWVILNKRKNKMKNDDRIIKKMEIKTELTDVIIPDAINYYQIKDGPIEDFNESDHLIESILQDCNGHELCNEMTNEEIYSYGSSFYTF